MRVNCLPNLGYPLYHKAAEDQPRSRHLTTRDEGGDYTRTTNDIAGITSVLAAYSKVVTGLLLRRCQLCTHRLRRVI
jgi:hypothetical protein